MSRGTTMPSGKPPALRRARHARTGFRPGLLCLAVLPWIGAGMPVGEGATPDLESAHRAAGAVPPWGATGHEMAARAAVAAIPAEMPAFFRDAAERLVYLNPEPDRWRVRQLREMDQGFSFDHYIDLENVPDGALEARDRWEFLRLLYAAGLERPERDAGFLPFRIMELYQRIVSEWRMWRETDDPARRAWIAERIVNDAGILGHYVTDASQPHHTTIHFNGWDRDTPNPEGYTRDNGFHARFETRFVEAHLTDADVARHVSTSPPRSVAGSARSAVMEHIMASHAEIETLYRLDRDVGFDPERPADPAAREFAAARLAAGADMLAALWWSAWVESASPLLQRMRDGASGAGEADSRIPVAGGGGA